MLKDITPRIYQETIFYTTTQKNTLVVLPTGMGKTIIALLLASHRLENYPKSKILILAPTRPLAEQHLETFNKKMNLKEDEVVLFTGKISPEKRAELWKDAKIIISTPQGLENDVISNKIRLDDVSLLVVDEAHRAVKDYAYVFIAKQYEKQAKHSRILGLTASPGSDMAQIEEVCANLQIEEIEIRTEEDYDVRPYVQEVDINFVEVDFPEEFKTIKNLLENVSKKKLSEVKVLGYLQGSISSYTKKAILGLQAELRGRISSGEKDYPILKSISLLAEAMKTQHALELVETQGLESLRKYFDKIDEQARTTSVKAAKNLVQDIDFIRAKKITSDLESKNIEHPKINTLAKIVLEEISNNKDTKIIIFAHFRTSSIKLKKILDEINISSKIFVGQAKKEGAGLSQKEQKEIIKEFSEGEFNCLISTSVGEEGLDIPQVDLVIFFEPIPSAIRSIQRRGRTGRLEKGKVIILITKNTRDEIYRWSSHHKEKRMYRNLKILKQKMFKPNRIIEKPKENKDLNEYVNENEEKLKIVVDYREKASRVIKTLIDENVEVELKTLNVGDYLLGEDVVVEYKTKKDFVDSIIDGRLLQQIRDLTGYLKPLLIIEGEEDIYSQRNIHSNAIRGMLATITISYRIPTIFTKNPQDTALLLKTIAKREQSKENREFQYHSLKPRTLKEQQEYIIGSLPGIGATLAKPLLKEFKSVKKIMNASEDKLKKVQLIGDKKAKKIREALDSEYKD